MGFRFYGVWSGGEGGWFWEKLRVFSRRYAIKERKRGRNERVRERAETRWFCRWGEKSKPLHRFIMQPTRAA